MRYYSWTLSIVVDVRESFQKYDIRYILSMDKGTNNGVNEASMKICRTCVYFRFISGYCIASDIFWPWSIIACAHSSISTVITVDTYHNLA